MLDALKNTSGVNLYYQKLKLEYLRYRTYYDAALQAERRGDCGKADAMMTRALAVEGKTADRNLRLGHCYEMQGMHREALRAYTAALQHQPEDSRINLLLGRVNIELARYPAARDLLQRVAADQRGGAWHYLMAEVLTALGDEASAKRHYAQAAALAGSLDTAADSVLQLGVE
jgi:tetratricopeptide (TPR) repeat protein